MGDELTTLMKLLSKLPGLGPRSGRRLALHLLKNRTTTLRQLIHSLIQVEEHVKTCSHCGNLDALDPCQICTDIKRDRSILCVIEDVADLWAIERTSSYKGLYHVLGGTLSALEGVGPQDLSINSLLTRCRDGVGTSGEINSVNDVGAADLTARFGSDGGVKEVILALNSTVDGQTTAHYLGDRLREVGIHKISSLARGLPMGGELDYLDDGTLITALDGRRVVGG